MPWGHEFLSEAVAERVSALVEMSLGSRARASGPVSRPWVVFPASECDRVRLRCEPVFPGDGRALRVRGEVFLLCWHQNQKCGSERALSLSPVERHTFARELLKRFAHHGFGLLQMLAPQLAFSQRR